MPHAVKLDMQLTDERLMFDYGAQVLDEDGTIVVKVNREQFIDDPEGVFAEMRQHMRANARAYIRPSHSLRVVRPRPTDENAHARVV